MTPPAPISASEVGTVGWEANRADRFEAENDRLKRERDAANKRAEVAEKLLSVASNEKAALEYRVDDAIGETEAAQRRATAAEAEAARMREALKPFADCVFNDNGDITTSFNMVTHDHLIAAYFAYRKKPADAAPAGGEGEEPECTCDRIKGPFDYPCAVHPDGTHTRVRAPTPPASGVRAGWLSDVLRAARETVDAWPAWKRAEIEAEVRASLDRLVGRG